MKLQAIEQYIKQIKGWLKQAFDDCETDLDRKIIAFLDDEATKFSMPLSFMGGYSCPIDIESRYGTFFRGLPITTNQYSWPYDSYNEPMSAIMQLDLFDFYKHEECIGDGELIEWLRSCIERNGNRYLQVWQSNKTLEESSIRLLPDLKPSELQTEYDFTNQQQKFLFNSDKDSSGDEEGLFLVERLFPFPSGGRFNHGDPPKLLGVPLLVGKQFADDFDDLIDTLIMRGLSEFSSEGVLQKLKSKFNKLSKFRKLSILGTEIPYSYYHGAYKPSHGLNDALDFYLDCQSGGWKCLFSVDYYEDPLMIIPRNSLLYRFKTHEEPEFKFIVG